MIWPISPGSMVMCLRAGQVRHQHRQRRSPLPRHGVRFSGHAHTMGRDRIRAGLRPRDPARWLGDASVRCHWRSDLRPRGIHDRLDRVCECAEHRSAHRAPPRAGPRIGILDSAALPDELRLRRSVGRAAAGNPECRSVHQQIVVQPARHAPGNARHRPPVHHVHHRRPPAIRDLHRSEHWTAHRPGHRALRAGRRHRSSDRADHVRDLPSARPR